MKAKELIKELQQISPDAEVTVTANNGTENIARFVRLSYTEGGTILTY